MLASGYLPEAYYLRKPDTGEGSDCAVSRDSTWGRPQGQGNNAYGDSAYKKQDDESPMATSTRHLRQSTLAAHPQ